MFKRREMMLDCMFDLEKKAGMSKRMSIEEQCNVHGEDQPRRLKLAHPSENCLAKVPAK
jgi:hypothetical protein